MASVNIAHINTMHSREIVHQHTMVIRSFFPLQSGGDLEDLEYLEDLGD